MICFFNIFVGKIRGSNFLMSDKNGNFLVLCVGNNLLLPSSPVHLFLL